MQRLGAVMTSLKTLRKITYVLLVFSVTPFKIDQNEIETVRIKSRI